MENKILQHSHCDEGWQAIIFGKYDWSHRHDECCGWQLLLNIGAIENEGFLNCKTERVSV